MAECWEFEKGGSRNRGSFINSVRKYSQELGFNEIKVGHSVCWPPVPQWTWTWTEADVDLTIKELTKKGDAGNIAVSVEEYLRNRWDKYINIQSGP